MSEQNGNDNGAAPEAPERSLHDPGLEAPYCARCGGHAERMHGLAATATAEISPPWSHSGEPARIGRVVAKGYTLPVADAVVECDEGHIWTSRVDAWAVARSLAHRDASGYPRPAEDEAGGEA